MAQDVEWKHLPMATPEGNLLVHASARLRTNIVDTVFQMIGGTERLADWAHKNPSDFYTKLWGKGMAKPLTLEVSETGSLEDLIGDLDGSRAKVINPDGTTVSLDELVADRE